jgi:hypothetical protein
MGRMNHFTNINNLLKEIEINRRGLQVLMDKQQYAALLVMRKTIP